MVSFGPILEAGWIWKIMNFGPVSKFGSHTRARILESTLEVPPPGINWMWAFV